MTYYGTVDRPAAKKAVDEPSVNDVPKAPIGELEERPAWHDPIFTRVFETLKMK